MRQLGPRYRGLLDGAFARKRLVYGLSAAGLVIAGIAYGAVGKTFMPTMDEGYIIVQITKMLYTDIEQSVQGDMAAHDRTSVEYGQRGSVRLDIGGRSII